jgi:LysR family hydrogen peroxide-inducible transcriptional activator
MHVSLTQLSYLVALGRLGSFGKAAEACGVTQPTLSMQLQKLEAEFGVVLFDRSRQPVTPTDVGAAVIEQARLVLREAWRIEDVLVASRGIMEGELRVGVIPTIGPYLLPRFLPGFVGKYPAVTLVVEELQTQPLLDRLRDDTLHAAIVATPARTEELIERPLFREPFLAYLPAGHPLASRERLDTAELTISEVLLLAEGHCFRDQVLELCRGKANGPAPGALHFASGNLETLKALVEQGCGITLLPALAREQDGRNSRAVTRPFVVPVPSRQIYLVHRRAYLKARLIEAFVAELLQSLPAAMRPVAATATSLTKTNR